MLPVNVCERRLVFPSDPCYLIAGECNDRQHAVYFGFLRAHLPFIFRFYKPSAHKRQKTKHFRRLRLFPQFFQHFAKLQTFVRRSRLRFENAHVQARNVRCVQGNPRKNARRLARTSARYRRHFACTRHSRFALRRVRSRRHHRNPRLAVQGRKARLPHFIGR